MSTGVTNGVDRAGFAGIWATRAAFYWTPMDLGIRIEHCLIFLGGTPLNAAAASGIGLLEFYTLSN